MPETKTTKPPEATMGLREHRTVAHARRHRYELTMKLRRRYQFIHTLRDCAMLTIAGSAAACVAWLLVVINPG